MIKKRKIDIFLIFILVLSAALNLYGIWNNDTDNAYYTAAVESMTQSFHNFFYASFDPAGLYQLINRLSHSGFKHFLHLCSACTAGASFSLKPLLK